MTVSEFVRWLAYAEMYPFGLEDLNFGRLLHLLASVYAPKGGRPKLPDFLLGSFPDNEPTADELEIKLNALVAQTNHENIRPDRNS